MEDDLQKNGRRPKQKQKQKKGRRPQQKILLLTQPERRP